MASTQKEQCFRDDFVEQKAEPAAIQASYSPFSASTIADDSFPKAAIVDPLTNSNLDTCDKSQITADWVLERLAAEALADLGDIFDINGTLLPVAEWPLIWRQGLITNIDVEIIKGPDGAEIGVLKKIKFSDRLKRLELIGRYIHMEASKNRAAPSGLDGLAERMERASERARSTSGEREAF